MTAKLDPRILAAVAARSAVLLADLRDRAGEYGLDVHTMPCGATLIDAGVNAPGSLAAGLRLIELCHGGLAAATLGLVDLDGFVLPEVTVESIHPSFSTYRLQTSYPVSEKTPGTRVSGPIRLRLDRSLPPDPAIPGAAVIESDRIPDEAIALAIAAASGLPPEALTLIVASVKSPVGAVQIAGRVNECVIFTMAESIGFDPEKVRQMVGQAPVCPAGGAARERPYPDDFIHYAGRVTLSLAAGPGDDLQSLAHDLTFASTPIYGAFFHELFARAGGVFENIPGLIDINKPAQVTINDLSTGRTVSAGAVDAARLAALIAGGER